MGHATQRSAQADCRSYPGAVSAWHGVKHGSGCGGRCLPRLPDLCTCLLAPLVCYKSVLATWRGCYRSESKTRAAVLKLRTVLLVLGGEAVFVTFLKAAAF